MESSTLPLKSVVLFIACGALVAMIVFIFAKRQITRFALKSSRQSAVGAEVPKSLRQEIERRIKRTQDIKHEPVLLSPYVEQMIEKKFQTGETCHFLYRMKAVDAIKLLDTELKRYSPHIKRSAMQNLRLFLLDQRQHGALYQIDINTLEKFVLAYEHARHHHAVFTQQHYDEYMDLLHQLIDFVKSKRKAENRGEPTPSCSWSKEPSPESNTPTEGDKDSGIQITFRPKKKQGVVAGVGVGEEAMAFIGNSSNRTSASSDQQAESAL